MKLSLFWYFFFNTLVCKWGLPPPHHNRSIQVPLYDKHAIQIGPVCLSLSEEINGGACQQYRATSLGSSNRISPAAVGQESDGDGGVSASTQG